MNNVIQKSDKAYKVWNYVPFSTESEYLEYCCRVPHNINYKIGISGRFQNNPSLDKGELVLMEYYATYDPETHTYTDKILDTEFVYDRNADHTANFRTKTVYWYFEDGTRDETNPKVMVKHYARAYEKQNEVQKRKKAMIDHIKGQGYGTPLYPYISALITELDPLIETFLEDVTNDPSPIANFVAAKDGTDPQYAWLDMNIGTPRTAREEIIYQCDRS